MVVKKPEKIQQTRKAVKNLIIILLRFQQTPTYGFKPVNRWLQNTLSIALYYVSVACNNCYLRLLLYFPINTKL